MDSLSWPDLSVVSVLLMCSKFIRSLTLPSEQLCNVRAVEQRICGEIAVHGRRHDHADVGEDTKQRVNFSRDCWLEVSSFVDDAKWVVS